VSANSANAVVEERDTCIRLRQQQVQIPGGFLSAEVTLLSAQIENAIQYGTLGVISAVFKIPLGGCWLARRTALSQSRRAVSSRFGRTAALAELTDMISGPADIISGICELQQLRYSALTITCLSMFVERFKTQPQRSR
jgi:hypothetical protein